MLRALSAGAVLCLLASTAAASGHYVEIWNPPEARVAQPLRKGRMKIGKAVLHGRNLSKVKPHRVAAPLVKSPASSHTSGGDIGWRIGPRFHHLPPVITPEGNVLRVSDRRMTVQVTH
jgi:hypothetical protein